MQTRAFRIHAARRKASALLATTILTAAFAPHAALAQSSSTTSTTDNEDIIVTGSQIARSGFETPTPVTVVGIEDFQRVATPNIADALNQMPALKASATPQSSTNLSKIAGANYLDLRGLTYLRTLTLVDGKRYMPVSPEGVINVNNIPQAVIGSVEVVTGGASAVYGSDAVAGVVNFKLDDKLDGVRSNAQFGISKYGDRENWLGSVAMGKSFGGGRGHILFGADYAKSEGIPRVGSRPWGNQTLINNPAYTATNNEPAYILVTDGRTSNSTYGGVINSATGTNGTALLRGITFLGNGQVGTFDYGTLTTSTTQQGGSGINNTEDLVLEQPFERWSALGKITYEISPSFNFYARVSYSGSKMVGDSIIGNDQITIQRDNVFIPAAVRTILNANPSITSFTMGRSLEDYARGYFKQDVWAWQAIGGLTGEIKNSWNYDFSFSYGKSRNKTVFMDARITAGWREAVDAIDNPATPGVVDPICRSTLTNPANGCIPLNLFGVIGDGEQEAAIANILGPSIRDWHQTQKTLDFLVRGNVVELPAGPVGFAGGIHWRNFRSETTSDPISASRPGGATVYRVGNTIPFQGTQDVWEAYGELLVPVLADLPFAEALDLNLAGRITDYKTSGQVKTWKVGVNYKINDMLRLRATRSRDIRAPNIQELFAAGQTLVFSINDTIRNETYLVSTTQGGNPYLVPEKADTFTAGVVLSPASRLRFSVDYYDIKIDGAIAALSAAQIVSSCIGGDAALCQLVTREASTEGTSPGRITGIRLAPANFQSIRTRGIDFEAAYDFDLWNGRADARVLANYQLKHEMVGVGGVVTNLVGSVAQPFIDGLNGTPRWRGQAILGFRNDMFRANVTGRYVGGGVVTRDYIATKPDVPITDPIKVNGRFYVDLSGEVGLFDVGSEGKVSLYGTILNALNNQPPITGYDGYGAPRHLFDVVGRQYTIGVRFNY
ncbi:TonB-dependent receptor [Sandaracinobacter neustonicus]|uniref:TonB-dependent receptor n=1 Tax=Sandaracinobacter neustonicus TaxID=1715348 RepID=A0A501XIT6_9SPHN|nr:TonB-dependent receptor [Sandaracinobacter neustonicus]TPE60552.1 TonB-dependent receptor [Sandaracinobacter neustonicus]